MSNQNYKFKNRDCINIFKRKLGKTLFAIISIGSFTTEHYKKKWSDIDLLIILNDLSLNNKLIISDIKKVLEKRYGNRFGINVITKKEALKPILPEIFLDGKTLQGLLELYIHPKRLMYCQQKKINFFVPDKELIQKYSLSNIAMFLLRNRKTLVSEYNTEIKKLKFLTEKEIRASFIITMLAIQYKTTQTLNGHKNIIKKAKEIFPDFNFSLLKNNENNIRDWESIKTKEALLNVLTKTELYIESFSKFILENYQKYL